MSAELTATDWRLPSPRKVGLISLLVAEIALFTIFVVAYLFYIGKSLTGPFPSEVLELPILASIALLSSSVTIVFAEKALHRGAIAGFRIWWFITILLAAYFMIYTGMEWHHLIYVDGLTISTNVFGSTYYCLVGLHASHVVMGMTLLSLVLAFSFAGKITPYHHEHIEMVSWYWHFVDVVWIVVFLVVYVIGR